ncbi:MAG: Do family serine endopeptidase [Spirochaetales bacterium]|nr:Do family serine endopeptidase [Spirochaetales bacterium]
MNKRKSVFYSKKFLIFNIALASMIVGFVLSTVLIYTFSGNGRVELPRAYAQDSDQVEKGYQALESIQSSFRNVAKTALPVVVEIKVIQAARQGGSQPDSPWRFFFGPPDSEGGNGPGREFEYRRPGGLGSGVIVTRDGDKVFVITNNHVVGDAVEMSVQLHDGRTYPGKIVAKDERVDLAMISFETRDQVSVARLGDSDVLEVGDWAIAVGNPFGLESSLTVGVVSALGRNAVRGSNISNYNEYIQTDAQINPGNSGGALLNLRGEVIGINTWIASSTGVSQGVGFAIPINGVKKVMSDFLTKGKVEYGWLGVGIDDPEEQSFPGVAEDLKLKGMKGALVVSVFKGSPAEKSGILPGDYITMADGRTVSDANTLTRIVGGLPPDRVVDFVLRRYGQERRLKVTLKVRESEDKLRATTAIWPGLNAIRLTDDFRRQLKAPSSVKGLLVSSVSPGTEAQSTGFKIGDVIVKMNDHAVTSVMDFYRFLNDKSKNKISFRIWRNEKESVIDLSR